MPHTRQMRESTLYGGSTFDGPTYTETGDVEVVVDETILAGTSVVFPMSVTAANLQALMAYSDLLTVVVTTSAADEILSATQATSLWALSSGAATPVPTGDFVSVTVDNSAGAVDAAVYIAALQETP